MDNTNYDKYVSNKQDYFNLKNDDISKTDTIIYTNTINYITYKSIYDQNNKNSTVFKSVNDCICTSQCGKSWGGTDNWCYVDNKQCPSAKYSMSRLSYYDDCKISPYYKILMDRCTHYYENIGKQLVITNYEYISGKNFSLYSAFYYDNYTFGKTIWNLLMDTLFYNNASKNIMDEYLRANVTKYNSPSNENDYDYNMITKIYYYFMQPKLASYTLSQKVASMKNRNMNLYVFEILINNLTKKYPNELSNIEKYKNLHIANNGKLKLFAEKKLANLNTGICTFFHNSGVCMYFASMVIMLLLLDDKFDNIPLEHAGSTYYDHSFVIVNRQNIKGGTLNGFSNIHDTKNYGQECFIVDFWGANVNLPGVKNGVVNITDDDRDVPINTIYSIQKTNTGFIKKYDRKYDNTFIRWHMLDYYATCTDEAIDIKEIKKFQYSINRCKGPYGEVFCMCRNGTCNKTCRIPLNNGSFVGMDDPINQRFTLVSFTIYQPKFRKYDKLLLETLMNSYINDFYNYGKDFTNNSYTPDSIFTSYNASTYDELKNDNKERFIREIKIAIDKFADNEKPSRRRNIILPRPAIFSNKPNIIPREQVILEYIRINYPKLMQRYGFINQIISDLETNNEYIGEDISEIESNITDWFTQIFSSNNDTTWIQKIINIFDNKWTIFLRNHKLDGKFNEFIGINKSE
jgi:hypothetical protein